MVFLKKLLLFSLVQTKEIIGRSIADQTLFTENSLPVDKEKEIYNINSIHGEIKILSNNIESYEFDKNFRITEITESLQQINGKNGLIVLDHDKFYYFEIINFNNDVINTFNNLFKKEIQEKKTKPLVDNEKNKELIKKYSDFLSKSKLKVEFVGETETSQIFKIKKSNLKFKKKDYIFAIESIQDGEKNNVENNCMLNCLKDFFISYYYSIKFYNNKEIVENFYETLLMFEDFLERLDKTINNLSKKDQMKFKTLITNPMDVNNNMLFFQQVMPKLVKNISIKKIKISKDLTEEDFNIIMNKIVNKIEYIMRKKYKHEGGTSTTFMMLLSLIFNLILCKNNDSEHFIPYLSVQQMNPQVFNPSKMIATLIMYNMTHIQYVYFTFNETDMKDYKKFIIDWYEKFDKNSVKKTFSETKYKLPKK